MKIIVCGCLGRLGAAVCKVAAETADAQVVAGTDIIASDNAAFPVYTEITRCEESADVIICCVPPTAAEEMLAILEFSAARQVPLVICSTGMPPEVEAAIEKAAEKAAVLRSANMSLGINLLSGVLNRVSRLLHGSGFDIEIIEKHHNQKLDAPSGTALLLADSVNSALDGKMDFVNDRSQAHAKRGRDEIGLHALRGGTIVGEHSVVFAGRDEILEFTHIAQSREIFATGALKATEFLRGKPAGIYTMMDVVDNL